MKAVILAGGSGKRLWPLSREEYPKQFLSIQGERSLLQETIERVSKFIDEIIVVTNERQYFHVLYQLEDMGLDSCFVLKEPEGKNTAPAIALATAFIMEKYGDDLVLVLPSDHVISDEFFKLAKKAESLASDHICTFGIDPTFPSTGYGYIKFGEKEGVGYKVEKFVEKPSFKKAEEYINDGHYLWNSGIFLYKASLLKKEFKKHLPDIHKYMESSEKLMANYKKLPRISIDYGIIEKSDKIAALKFQGKWQDIGSWNSVYDILEKDSKGNAVQGDAINIDTKNSLVFGDSRLVATIGLDDMTIIDTKDVLLVAKKDKSQDVKKIIEKLKEDGRMEYKLGTTVYKPWGYYTVLEEGDRYKVKRLALYPGKSISHQLHHHRAEHWIVVKGTAKVTKGEEEIFVHENESIYVPKSTKHRMENPGKVNLHIIETQTGEYIEEDDIIRLEDKYGRK